MTLVSFIVLELTPLKITRLKIPLEFCVLGLFMWRTKILRSKKSRGKGKVYREILVIGCPVTSETNFLPKSKQETNNNTSGPGGRNCAVQGDRRSQGGPDGHRSAGSSQPMWPRGHFQGQKTTSVNGRRGGGLWGRLKKGWGRIVGWDRLGVPRWQPMCTNGLRGNGTVCPLAKKAGGSPGNTTWDKRSWSPIP